MKTRSIEMIICYPGSGGDSGYWSTSFIDIPANTLEDYIEEKAIAAMEDRLNKQKVDTAFVGVYWIPNDEEEDE
jgi:hypothetical protein